MNNIETQTAENREQVLPGFRENSCPLCEKRYGRRTVVKASDERIVHKVCREKYEAKVRQLRQEQQRADEEAQREAAAAARKAVQERRGTDLEAFCKRAVTKDMSREEVREITFFEKAWRMLRRGRRDLADWTVKLQDNPVYAMEWSMTAFSSAAEVQVGTLVEGAFKAGLTVQQICQDLTKEALRETQFPSRSTSPAHNIMAQELARMKVEMSENLYW